MSSYIIDIRLGNDMMQTGGDVAGALRKLADRIEEESPELEPHSLFDVNGNRVGEASLQLETLEELGEELQAYREAREADAEEYRKFEKQHAKYRTNRNGY